MLLLLLLLVLPMLLLLLLLRCFILFLFFNLLQMSQSRCGFLAFNCIFGCVASAKKCGALSNLFRFMA